MSDLLRLTNSRRTGIVATVGPASESIETLEKMLLAGVDIFRFSYGRDSLRENRRRITRLKEAQVRTGCSAKLLMDLPGRKNRIVSHGTSWVNAGDQCLLRYKSAVRQISQSEIQVLFPIAVEDMKQGGLVYFGDGEFSAHIISIINKKSILVEFDNSGELASGRGVTVVGVDLEPRRALTARDKYFLMQHLSLGYQFVALSFVNSPEDILELKASIKKITRSEFQIIAKIETEQGVINLNDILTVSNGVMIGRGDLCLNIPFEQLPIVQKKIIEQANLREKIVIVATQMLESVSERQIPLRSEIIDIATAVSQGASAIMLSGETRTGKRPVYAVQMADRIIRRMEKEQ